MLFSGLLPALFLLGVVHGTFLMQWPPGSNNRLDGQSRERRNGRRLFDSQNNGRGGYNRGTGRFYWFESSMVPIIWTQDQGCMEPSSKCTYVVQFYCHEHLRDGWYTDSTQFDTIPYEDQSFCRIDQLRRAGKWENENCTFDYRYGMHEIKEYYDECRQRSRNKGLWIADQGLRGEGSIFTRQNPGGTRFGYECPEEKDYYPYWNPSPWRDLAILTYDTSRCNEFIEASQNTKERYVCRFSEEMHRYAATRRWTGYVPINEQDCVSPRPCPQNNGIAGCLVVNEEGVELNLGTWERVEPHGIPEPICTNPFHQERPNALSNPYNAMGYEAGFNWTVPDWFVEQYQNQIDAERCVLRIRHNATPGDPGFKDGGYRSPTSVQSGVLDHTYNSVDEDGAGRASRTDFPSRYPVWEKYGLTDADVEAAFNATERAKGNYGRGYVLGNEPKVDIFGSLIDKPLYLNLAINTQDTFRVFQDRTHGFAIRERPAHLVGLDIINLSVKGKRGNIVQTWPAHEYDFQPSPLEVKSGSLLHIQWNGANTNPRNNAGEGPQGFDRSNIVVLGERMYEEHAHLDPVTGKEVLTYGQLGRNYPQHFGYNPLNPRTPSSKPGEEKGRFLNWEWKDNYVLSYPPLMSGYFDFGLQQVKADVKTTYNYISTRNNNFSNRSQKGQITIIPRTAEEGAEPLVYIPKRDSLRQIPGVAFVQYDRDERKGYQQAIEITAGQNMHGFASPWIKLWPRLISMPDGQGTIQLFMYHDWRPFQFGRIYWAEAPDPEKYDLVQMNTESDTLSWGSQALCSTWINQGGYYVVKNEINWTGVGGAIVGVALCGIIGFFLFQKFGCRFVGGSTYTGARDPLVEQRSKTVKPVRSDDPVPVATTGGETQVANPGMAVQTA